MYDIVIIGGGPAGLTAAVYARRAGKSVLIVEKGTFGGQITWSPRVENYPGFASVTGVELGDKMLEQAMAQGADTELEEVTGVRRCDDDGLTVFCESGAVFKARSVILATGAKPRPLGVERETELVGSGVSYCAVCDGAFYKGRTVAVVGGGNSALQDALLLSETCEAVYLIHRRADFRGEQKLAEALDRRANVRFVLESTVVELLGEDELRGVVVERANGERRELAVDGLFVAIGGEPDNASFSTLLKLDDAGYAETGEDCASPTPGVFVAGDCRAKTVRQLTTAVADGAVAAISAIRWLDEA